MQDYEAEARRKQEEQEQQKYQQQRDPFQYGQQVARRRYSEIMSGLDERQRQSSRSYSDMYQAARQQAVAQRAAGAPSLSGGMAAQYSDLVSAREMQQLGAIGAQREEAARAIDLQRQSAFANAQLEGQQATQFELQNQQTQLGIIQQKNQILADEVLTNEQKAEQLQTLGYGAEAEQLLTEGEEGAGGNKVFTGILGVGGGALLGTAVIGGKAAAGGVLATLGGALGAVASVAIPVAAVAAIVWGIDELVEASTGGEGFLSFI